MSGAGHLYCAACECQTGVEWDGNNLECDACLAVLAVKPGGRAMSDILSEVEKIALSGDKNAIVQLVSEIRRLRRESKELEQNNAELKVLNDNANRNTEAMSESAQTAWRRVEGLDQEKARVVRLRAIARMVRYLHPDLDKLLDGLKPGDL